MSLNNKAQLRKIEGMSKELKLAYYASASRVTVGRITQVFDHTLKVFYVAKIRGIIVGDKDDYRHETHEAAQKYGKEILAQWRAEFLKSKSTEKASKDE